MSISVSDNLHDKELDDLKARWASELADIESDSTEELNDTENEDPLAGRYESKLEKFQEQPLEPWDLSSRRGIEAKIQKSFEQFDKLIQDDTVSIKQLMQVINKLRVQGAALARRVAKEEVVITEEGCDTSLSNLQKELSKTNSIWIECLATVFSTAGGALGQVNKDQPMTFNARGTEGTVVLMGAVLGGIAKSWNLGSQSLQEGYRMRSNALVQRATAERQGDTNKQNEQTTAIQAGKELDQAEGQTIRTILS